MSEIQYPSQLKEAKLNTLNNTEAFLKIMQLGYEKTNLSSSGLALNNRQEQLNAGQILSILLAEDQSSKLLSDLQLNYF